MHPPLALNKARMYGFWVPGSRDALQASVDGTLNAGSGGRMQFTVVTPYVLLSFTEVGQAHSNWPEDRAKGWGREIDIVAWVMLAATKPGHALPAFYAYPLHIWVDDCMALIVGREVFGYPKYQCSYAMPVPGGAATGFRLGAKGFQPFAPDTELAMHPLLGVDATGEVGVGSPVLDAEDWRQRLLSGLHSQPGFWAADPAWRDAFDDWFDLFPGVDQIFLKQFPDASGQCAVYQGIVAAEAKIQAIHGLWLLDSGYALDLQAFDSFPLARTLGWRLGAQPAYCGFRVDFDFEVKAGVELVDNSRSGQEPG